MFDGSPQDTQAAYRYASAHSPGSVTVAVSSQEGAASGILRGRSVAGVGGFTGTETVLTTGFLKQAVASGRLRYFLLDPPAGSRGGFGGMGRFGRQPNRAEQTVERVCTQVPASRWNGGASSSGGILYDCEGRSAAIASSGG
jgi:hypothetical protein